MLRRMLGMAFNSSKQMSFVEQLRQDVIQREFTSSNSMLQNMLKQVPVLSIDHYRLLVL